MAYSTDIAAAGASRCAATGSPRKSERLTALQRATLQRLADLDARNKLVGFNPRSFGGERAAACARSLAGRGLVSLSRVSERHIRYSITVNGLMALAGEPRATL